MELSQSNVVHPASLHEDMELTATHPDEMVASQQQLIAWATQKCAILKGEAAELGEAVERAKKMKWKTRAMYNLHRSAVKRLEYYEKIKSALEAGFYIVPNFPIQMFAIKTTKGKPKYATTYDHWNSDFVQKAQELPIGEGEYQNPRPLVYSKPVQDGVEKKTLYWPKEWDDLEFPITMAKPTIMEATNRAMALKIFDKIGIMPAVKKEDPVIIGQIFRKQGYHVKTVSFMIAWHLNTNVL